MASKELIEELAETLFEIEHGRFAKQLYYPKIHYEEMAKAAISTILAALQEPTEGMQLVVSANWGRRTWAEYQQVLNASAHGEQSE